MDNQENIHLFKKGFVIKCECGFEIPVIPELESVGSTIDAHVEEHRKSQKDPQKGEIAAKSVHDHLFKKLFEKISQVNM